MRLSALALIVAMLAACSNTPPPPVVNKPAAPVTPPPETSPSQIVVGVDDIAGGYNPHNMADGSTITSALSQLLLPSVFRESGEGNGAERQLDPNLMRSADVVSEEPFTVAYEIRPDASWSDGAPIAAEDFVYLAEAMRSEPGVVQPAGYQLISNIESREGGKRVEVTFSKPYPGWRELFSNLLPQHLLKDAPGGWQGALQGSFPAYGGPFSVKTLDSDRGEIILERNDKYWEKPAAIDRVVLRRADQPGLASALRSGNDQFVVARTDGTGMKLLGELGEDIDLHSIAQPQVADLLLRPVNMLADERVRGAVTNLIDRDKLIDEGVDGGPSAALRADAQVLPPSAPGYAPTLPESGQPGTPDQAKAEEALKGAGYTRTAGTWQKDGKPLSLVLAAPGEQEPYARIAKELSRQLIAAGIDVHTITPEPRELFGSSLVTSGPSDQQSDAADSAGEVGVDLAVVPQSTGGDPASSLASTFGCRQPDVRDKEDEDQGQKDKSPPNQAAFCDKSLQPTIDAALTGSMSTDEALKTLEPELWRRNVVMPLFQLADTLAIGQGVSGVTPGPVFEGPFSSAVNWTRRTK